MAETPETLRALGENLVVHGTPAEVEREAEEIGAHAIAWAANLRQRQAAENNRAYFEQAYVDECARTAALQRRLEDFPWFMLEEAAHFLRERDDLKNDLDARNLAYRLELAALARSPEEAK